MKKESTNIMLFALGITLGIILGFLISNNLSMKFRRFSVAMSGGERVSYVTRFDNKTGEAEVATLLPGEVRDWIKVDIK